MIRLFAGLTLPPSIRSRILLLQTGIRGARWQNDSQLHLTLAFIGEIDESAARDLDWALSSIRMPSFSLSISGTGLFGTPRAPRELWLGVSPKDAVTRLSHKVEMAARRVGIETEVRKFIPHVTVARLNRNRGAEAGIEAFLATHGVIKTEPFAITEFALFSSQLSPLGSRYQIEARYPLTSGYDGHDTDAEDEYSADHDLDKDDLPDDLPSR